MNELWELLEYLRTHVKGNPEVWCYAEQTQLPPRNIVINFSWFAGKDIEDIKGRHVQDFGSLHSLNVDQWDLADKDQKRSIRDAIVHIINGQYDRIIKLQ